MSDLQTTYRNRLAQEKSPYLLQHATNPVDWYPWGEEAFLKARQENKPVFLSIGYSTCHWCHVMEEESFADPKVAQLMNDAFVSIKVDREERPDIDNTYMMVCQMLTGGGGWPLNIIMTPEKKPFFAGTYIPRENRFGRIGMLELVPRVKALWEERREELEGNANQIAVAVGKKSEEAAGEELGEKVLEVAYQQLWGLFDSEHGGFGLAPKFPTPHHLTFLLRYWKRSGENKARAMVERSLEGMRRGGIYDQVGFGFHRYSTDARWFLPHFEKMLYDQALLAMAYSEAYQVTGKREYRKTAEEIFTYVLRDMTSPEGGFYSAEDADSEGEEGKFYLWDEEEIRKLLGQEAELVIKLFNIHPNGNFHEEATGTSTGRNILYLERPMAEIASDLGLEVDEVQRRWEKARQQLFAAREARAHPHKDDKILTDWNGLMIAALSKGSLAFGEEKYLEAAKRAADFLLTKMRDSQGRLYHRYREGEAAVPGFLDDYAFFTWGLIELSEASFETDYLRAAFDLSEILIEHFWDKEHAALFITPDDGETVLVRGKEIYDGALPSGNSVAMLNLLRLGRITGRTELEEKAAQISRAFSRTIADSPANYTQLLCALDFALGPAYEVVIVGHPLAEDTIAMIQVLNREFTPNKVVLFKPTDQINPAIARLAPFLAPMIAKDGKATAYVCQNYQCSLPTSDPSKMLELLHNQQSSSAD